MEIVSTLTRANIDRPESIRRRLRKLPAKTTPQSAIEDWAARKFGSSHSGCAAREVCTFERRIEAGSRRLRRELRRLTGARVSESRGGVRSMRAATGRNEADLVEELAEPGERLQWSRRA